MKSERLKLRQENRDKEREMIRELQDLYKIVCRIAGGKTLHWGDDKAGEELYANVVADAHRVIREYFTIERGNYVQLPDGSDGAVYLGDTVIGYVAPGGPRAHASDWWARIEKANSHRRRFALRGDAVAYLVRRARRVAARTQAT